MRTYLAVIDDSAEARVALRFAARRAARTAGAVALLAFVPPAEFVQWVSVQAAMEEEERLRVEAMVADVAGALFAELGIHPEIVIRTGEPIDEVAAVLKARPDIDALVLGARAHGGPGELVAHFTGIGAGQLPCPVMVIPGGLDDAALDRLS